MIRTQQKCYFVLHRTRQVCHGGCKTEFTAPEIDAEILVPFAI